MKARYMFMIVALGAGLGSKARADVINGGFEPSLSGWTVLNQTGSEGSFQSQTGTTSPVNGITVAAPPQGSRAAMTDGEGPGTHILYQDIFIPLNTGIASITFSYYLKNGAPAWANPGHLDFSGTAQNQQARVDLMTTSADPFSTAPADILQNLFLTTAATPLTTGYTTLTVGFNALAQTRSGQTIRLRFAEVDNVFTLNFGVDNVSFATEPAPEPSTWVFGVTALAGLALLRRNR